MSSASVHIRGRNPPRHPLHNHPYPSQGTMLNRPFRLTTSRPRTYLPTFVKSETTPLHCDDSKKPRHFLIRIPPTTLIGSAITLALFLYGLAVSSNLATVVVSPGARDLPLGAPTHQRTPASSISVFYPVDHHNSTNDTQIVPPSKKLDHGQPLTLPSKHILGLEHPQNEAPLTSRQQSSDNVQPITQKHTSFQEMQSNRSGTEEQSHQNPMNGRVSWKRSWPSSPELDETKLIPIAKALKFSNHTLVNYFHMHKTGGVTLKSELMAVINRAENRAKAAERENGLSYIETCYEVESKPDEKSLESAWRCDFGKVRKMTAEQLAAVDIVMGHQYWNEGTEIFFSKKRDVRHFSIFRHPLPRKLSFFYHFFVRNFGRNETNVNQDEVIKFLLGDEMPDVASIRDAGPNYYASRLLSDGLTGFVGHRFELTRRQSDDAISNVIGKLDRKYALVGLQQQNEASQCMLEKLIQVLAHGHGIDDLVGTPKLSFNTAKLNTGGYTWTPTKIWKAMTVEQRKKYKQVERVDLAIYEKAVQKFKQDVRLFSCEEKVREEAFLEDVFE